AAQQLEPRCVLDPACQRWVDFITVYTSNRCRLHHKKGVNCRDVRDQAAEAAFLACMSERADCPPGATCLVDDGRPPICCLPGERAEHGRCRSPPKPKNPDVSCWLSGKVWAPHMSPHCREHGICTKEATGVDDKYQCDYWQNPKLKEGEKNFACCRSYQSCDSGQRGVDATGEPYGVRSDGWA